MPHNWKHAFMPCGREYDGQHNVAVTWARVHCKACKMCQALTKAGVRYVLEDFTTPDDVKMSKYDGISYPAVMRKMIDAEVCRPDPLLEPGIAVRMLPG